MQYMILALALVSVPVPEHRLENPKSLKQIFLGERQLINEYCSSDMPVLYSVYPGPSRLPQATITKCVPEQGSKTIEITCVSEYTCQVVESNIAPNVLAEFLRKWSEERKRP